MRVGANKRERKEEEDNHDREDDKLSMLAKVRVARKQQRQRKRLAETLKRATEMLHKNPSGLVTKVKFDTTCPYCNEPQSQDDVLKGASSSPVDITTKCTECDDRYATTLDLLEDDLMTSQVPWLCPDQTLDQYKFWLESKPTDMGLLNIERPDIYYNALSYALKMALNGNNDADLVFAFLTQKV